MRVKHVLQWWLVIGYLALVAWGRTAAGPADLTPRAYLPLVARPQGETPPYEARGLWISRFEWTSQYNVATPARIDQMVGNAAGANFNMLLFQVRGTADAFYASGLEPWSARLNSVGQLGLNPGWDPLAYLVTSAHAAGLQVHAYLNTYPTWYGESPPISTTVPVHPFWTWSWGSPGWADWRLWDAGGPMLLNPSYLFASPGAPLVADHIVAVAQDIAARYAVDGIHLDYVRYSGYQYSCDPFSESRFGAECFSQPGWEDWQRSQVTQLVGRIKAAIPADRLLSAAVWPIYVDRWGWGVAEGREDFYQDSQAWTESGTIDAIMPMIYPANYGNDFWIRERFATLVDDFQAHAGSRYVIAGIGGGYDSFEEIAWRIETARTAGTAGHAIFSYGGLDQKGYWDDLVAPGGPHAEPALPPPVP